ncbi:kinase domain protein (macronuclear) [Tetrahymena thermophila SB210]|uniref:Kinase domain protein n=1 Tax=Tetrahymena thermophila (strain SB210) TaxID=312017 RepID=I7MD58_TETTS|nr:kinase domain protein [Tetrahymena thermophila SB210]EAR85542.3 kinase domain protein [Tetrahymena thermophila SB210]|eukprot:XP_001033205.3 kinase domain protein [Tetrahymena thermophila SB210]
MSQSSIDFKEYQVFEEHLFEEIELESIVKLQFNEETLKKNFEVLIKILKDLKIGVAKSNQRSAQNEKEIKELQKDNQQLKKDVDGLKDQNQNLLDEIQKLKEKDELQQQEINQLKDENKANQEKIEQQQKTIDELSKDNQKNKEDIAYLMDELKKLKSEIDSIKLQMSLLSGNGIDQDALSKLLKEIQKIKDEYVTKIEYRQQVTIFQEDIEWIKEELEKLRKQLEQLKNEMAELQGVKDLSNLKDQISSILNRLKVIEASLKDKVDYEIFEQQINYLKQLISSLGGKEITQQIIQPGLSAKEAALLKELDKRVSDLEDAIRELRRDLKEHKNDYADYTQKTNGRLDKIEDLLSQLQKQIALMKQLKDQLDKLTSAHQETNNIALTNQQKIKELQKLLDQLYQLFRENKPEVTLNQGGGISEEYLESRLNQLRDELLRLIKDLRDQLNDKVSFSDLYKSEALIMSKLDQVAEAILKKCADKSETKKALIYLEKKINQLFFLLQELKGNGNGKDKPREEDALLARKQLWSCVSCDKALDEYNGRLGDHKYWGQFPPKETTPERLGKFGKQFRFMQEKQLMREKQFEKQKLAQSTHHFQQRFKNLPGQQFEEGELPQINAKATY